jgi:hypothetical protein
MKPAKKMTKAAAIWKSGFRRTGNVIGNRLCDDRYACFQTPGITKKDLPLESGWRGLCSKISAIWLASAIGERLDSGQSIAVNVV